MRGYIVHTAGEKPSGNDPQQCTRCGEVLSAGELCFEPGREVAISHFNGVPTNPSHLYVVPLGRELDLDERRCLNMLEDIDAPYGKPPFSPRGNYDAGIYDGLEGEE